MVVQQISKIVISVRRPEIDFVSNENDWHFVIYLRNPWHPVRFKALDALEVGHIVHKNYDVSFVYLHVSILFIILGR
jgi:hypothetical protein